MLSIKKLLTAAVCIGSLAGSVAFAGGLTIDNRTDYFSTAVINNGACSNKLPFGKGITNPHSVNDINEYLVKFACMSDTHNCKADIYMTNDCSGPVVANATFDVDQGITDFQLQDNRFDVKINGYSVIIDNA